MKNLPAVLIAICFAVMSCQSASQEQTALAPEEIKAKVDSIVAAAMVTLATRVVEIESWPADSVATSDYILAERRIVVNAVMKINFASVYYDNPNEMFSQARLDPVTSNKVAELINLYTISTAGKMFDAFFNVEWSLRDYAKAEKARESARNFHDKLCVRHVHWPESWRTFWIPPANRI